MADGFSDAEHDLFGNPVEEPRGPGRPPHVPTAESRRFVNMLFVCGHPPLSVAKALGLKKSAFYGHYKAEIRERQLAALKFRGHQLLRLNRQAENGNVAAEKALAAMIHAEQLRATSATYTDTPVAKPKAKPAAPLGKKEEANLAAAKVDGMYAPPEPPLRLN